MGGARTAKVSRPKSKQATTDDAQRSFFSKARSQLTPAFACGDFETRTTPKLTPGFWKSMPDASITLSQLLACHWLCVSKTTTIMRLWFYYLLLYQPLGQSCQGQGLDTASRPHEHLTKTKAFVRLRMRIQKGVQENLKMVMILKLRLICRDPEVSAKLKQHAAMERGEKSKNQFQLKV